jgi:hypothetical protein
MQKPLWWQVTLIAAGTVAIFIISFAFINFLNDLFKWGGPSENVTVVMAALIAAIIPVSLVWERLDKLKVFDIEIDLADFVGKVVELPSELHDPAFLSMGPSYLPVIIEKMRATINQSPSPEIITINLDSGPVWWSTRVFLVAALAENYTRVRQIYFVENCTGPIVCFVGGATPRAVRRALMTNFPELAAVNALMHGETNWEAAVQQFQQALQPPDNPKKEEQMAVAVSKQSLRDWLGEDLVTQYIDWEPDPPSARTLQQIISRPEPFVAIVQNSRLRLCVDRLELMAQIATSALKQSQ